MTNKKKLFVFAILWHKETGTEFIQKPGYRLAEDQETLRKHLLIECSDHKDHITDIEIIIRPF
jgi:hypothetical protein